MFTRSSHFFKFEAIQPIYILLSLFTLISLHFSPFYILYFWTIWRPMDVIFIVIFMIFVHFVQNLMMLELAHLLWWILWGRWWLEGGIFVLPTFSFSSLPFMIGFLLCCSSNIYFSSLFRFHLIAFTEQTIKQVEKVILYFFFAHIDQCFLSFSSSTHV